VEVKVFNENPKFLAILDKIDLKEIEFDENSNVEY